MILPMTCDTAAKVLARLIPKLYLTTSAKKEIVLERMVFNDVSVYSIKVAGSKTVCFTNLRCLEYK